MQEKRLAVLIDGDNASFRKLDEMMAELAKFGVPTLKRIYGDWTRSNNDGWKTQLLENAITPVQQFAYTTGKNATDSALIIDAMDILYSNKVDGFCIVSSDSDFTRLATRLREAGKFVIGMGEEKTPQAFISACDRFIYLSVINPKQNKKALVSESKRSQLLELIRTSIDDVADDSGYAFLADVGNLMNKKRPDFDPRNYGYMKLSLLIKSFKEFEVDERPTGNSNVKHVFIKNKRG